MDLEFLYSQFLQIFDGEEKVETLKGKMYVTTSFTSKNGQLTLHFKSDHSLERSGFEATYVAFGK